MPRCTCAAHHVVTDGLAGLRLAGRFLDGDEIDIREETAPASGRRSGNANIDLTKALRPLQVAVNAPRPGNGQCHRPRPAGGRRPRNVRFPTGGHHRRCALAVARRALHDDPLRGHLDPGRPARPRWLWAVAGTTCSWPARRRDSVWITSGSVSPATSSGSPPPRLSVEATMSATGTTPRAVSADRPASPGRPTSISSPTV